MEELDLQMGRWNKVRWEQSIQNREKRLHKDPERPEHRARPGMASEHDATKWSL